ncbi:MAG: ATP-binding cassette domain-containing protein [Pseudomonadota bacterium]|nr:ATP-binding cassette domain-containing protein [Pseudomonadota bacterium]
MITGPSACGKTVLLKCTIGLLISDSGTLRFYGEDTASFSNRDRELFKADAGMLFQQSALFDRMTVWKSIGFRLDQTQDMGRTEVRQIAVQKLSNVGLNSDVADLYPNELSGGVKKRVGLARVISDTPKILLLNEPTVGLDPIMTNNINQLIKRNAEIIGATTVSVTSDMDGAQNIADRIAMIFECKTGWCGPVEEADK